MYKKTIYLMFLFLVNFAGLKAVNLDLALKELQGATQIKKPGIYAEAFKIPDVLLPQEYIDNPEKILGQANSKKKIYILNKLAKDSWKTSYQKSLEYADQALEISQYSHLDFGLVISHITKAQTYLNMNDYQNATDQFLKAESVVINMRDKTDLPAIYDGLTHVWTMANNKDKALEYAFKSYQLVEKENNYKAISDNLIIIGNVFFQFNDFQNAIDYYFRALDIEEENQLIWRKGLIHNNLAMAFYNLGDFAEAERNINNLLISAESLKNKWELADGLAFRAFLNGKMALYDLALKDYQSAKKIFQDIKDFSSQIKTDISIGNILTLQGKFKQAQDIYLKAKVMAANYHHITGMAALVNNMAVIDQIYLQYEKALDQHLYSLNLEKQEANERGIITSLYNLGNLYLKLSNFDESLNSFMESLHKSVKINDQFLIKEIYYRLADLFASQGEFEKALEYHQKYSDLNFKLNIADMQTRFEVGKKRYQVELLKKQNTILNLQKSRLWIGLLSLSLLVILMIWLNHAKSKLNRELINEVNQRSRTEDDLKNIKSELELRVRTRTAELTRLNDSLQKEVSERRQYQEKLELSLEEKDVLIKEIHHRVKNNMQVISSLLKMQANYIEDESIVEIFEDSYHRVKSMSLIHEKLYRSNDLARIDFKDYVNSLTRLLYNTISPNKQITFNLEMKNIFLDVNIAIPCGLIINELITNSLKYAFCDRENGEIVIKMNHDLFKGYTLIISDNGKGLPEDFEVTKTRSLGMRLVMLLSEDQLEGKVMINSSGGTEFVITFPGISD